MRKGFKKTLDEEEVQGFLETLKKEAADGLQAAISFRITDVRSLIDPIK